MKARVSDARTEIARLRRATLKAIREHDEDVVDRNLDIYRELVVVFIRRLHSYGATFDKQSAVREATAFPGKGWPELDWIGDDYRDILEASFANPHRGILGSVLYFPTSIAAASLHERDYVTFYRLVLAYPQAAYVWSLNLPDQLREFVVDRIPRYLSEFSRFHVAPAFERAEDLQEIQRLGDIWEGLIVVFGELLKAAKDKNDLPAFNLFIRNLNGLFEGVADGMPGYEQWLFLRGANDQLRTSSQRMSLFTAVQDVLDRLETLSAVARFGVNAWVTKEFANGLMTPVALQTWFEACGSFGDVSRLTRTFLSARSIETQDLMKWSWWALEGVENQVVSISLEHHLDRAYLLHAINAFVDKADVDLVAKDVLATRELAQLIDRDDSPLRKLLHELAGSAEKWKIILHVDPEVAFANLSRVFDRIVERQRREWHQQVIGSPLDPARVQRFKEDVLAGYENASHTRDFFKEVGRYEVKEGTGGWGVNRVLPKDIFVAGSNIVVSGFGDRYGEGIAESLGERSLKTIVAVIPSADERAIGEPIDGLCTVGTELRSKGLKPAVILLRSWMTYTRLFNDSRFSAASPRQSAKGRTALIGVLDGMPVYQLHWSKEAIAIVGDFGALGVYRQIRLQPDSTQQEELLGGELLFMLKPVTAELATTMIEKQSDFLKNPDSGQRESLEIARLRLQGRVHFRLFGNAEFIVERSDSARSLRLPRG